MSEELEESVEQETAQAVAPAEESQSAEEVQKAEAFAQKSQDDQNRNWKEARRKMQELEQKLGEKDEVIKRLTVPTPAKAEEDYGIEDDALAEGKHIKELKKELKELKSYIKTQEVSAVDTRLQVMYPDFNQVVNKENIETLKQIEPELAESLSYYPDPYKQAVAAYKLLKKAGIGETEVVGNTSSKEKDRAIKNGQKPVSVNAVTKQSAIGNAHMFENGLTPELKASLLKEMREATKRA